MNDASRTVLELFATKAEKLATMRFTQRIDEQGGVVQWRSGDDQLWQLGVQDEEVEAFILTFRLFIQAKEPISFRAVARLLDDSSVSDEWKNEFTQARTTVNLIRQGQLAHLVVDGQPLTREDVLQAFIYGNLAHTERAKRNTFERWQRDPDLFAKAQFEFVTLLVGILDQIFRVALACRQELEQNGHGDSDQHR